jgi:hypothetical protein
MQKFIRKPIIDFETGIVVDKDTTLEFSNENVEQTLKDLTFKSITKVKGDGFESEYHTTIHLKEGDVMIFEEKGRGYIKPVEEFVTVKEAIEELECIKDI